MLRCLRRVVASLLLAGGAFAHAQGVPAAFGAPVGTVCGPVPVASVVDGDTFVVASNVGPRTVRLVGVDAPATRAPAQPLGAEPLDTRGYDVWDRGSGSVFRLPVGVQAAGALRVPNPGQGVWNNGGDVIHLRRGGELVDAWDYSGVPLSAGGIACRDGR